MVKLIFTIRMREDVGAAAGLRYWREQHAPTFAAVADTLNAVRYVQSHIIDTPINQGMRDVRGGMTPPFEGVTEIWFNSMDDVLAGVATPEGQQAAAMLAQDETNFIDFERSTVFMTEEIEIFDRTR